MIDGRAGGRGNPRRQHHPDADRERNLFLPSTRSVVRKALEIPLAMWMDVLWTKAANDGNLSQHRRMGRRGSMASKPPAQAYFGK